MFSQSEAKAPSSQFLKILLFSLNIVSYHLSYLKTLVLVATKFI